MVLNKTNMHFRNSFYVEQVIKWTLQIIKYLGVYNYKRFKTLSFYLKNDKIIISLSERECQIFTTHKR